MSRYVLYNHMDGGSIINLGRDIKKVKPKIKKHFIDVLNSSEEYSEEQLSNVNTILNKEYKDFIELQIDYNNFNVLGDWIIKLANS